MERRQTSLWQWWWGGGMILILLFASALGLGESGKEYVLADFATGLAKRTPMQRHNAFLAVQRIDGTILAPDEVFSFNRAAGPYTRDQGYKKAPVSFSGEILITWGGGVCQVSSTLYNAALLAGMEIVEREPHVWAPRYIPPGRDAAVAYGLVDLRFRNPLPEPVRIEGRIEGDRLRFRLLSHARPPASYRIVTERCEWLPAVPLVAFRHHRSEGELIRRHPGYPGFLVRTYRLIQYGDHVEREWLSEDVYPAMSPRVEVGVGE